MNSLPQINLKNFLFLALGGIFLAILYPFLPALLLGGTLAFALHPIQSKYFKGKFHLGKYVSVYLIIACLLLSTLPIVLAVLQSVRTIQEMFRDPKIQAKLIEFVNSLFAKIRELPLLSDRLSAQFIDDISNFFIERLVPVILEISTRVLSSFPDFVLFVFLLTASLYYFLIDHQRIKGFLQDLKIVDKVFLNKIIVVFQSASQSSLIAAFFVGIVQATILTLASSLLGIDQALTVFVFSFFFSLVPLVGTAPVTLTLALFFLINGQGPAAIVILCAGVFAGLTDNFVRPFVLNRQDKLHPLLGLLGALGGIYVFGPSGVIVGPIICSAFIRLLTIMNNSGG